MTALALLGEMMTAGVCGEKVMWSFFGTLNLRPENIQASIDLE